MGLETLLEAAKYLDTVDQNSASVGGHLLIDPNIPISSQFHTYSSSASSRPLSLSGNVSNQLNKYSSAATTGRTPRRRTKSKSPSNGEKDLDAFKRHRELHKTLEKNRRDHLRDCFELLRIELPQTKYSKSSHINIIYCALRHIQQLKQAAIEGDIEIEKLARTRIRLENTVVQLKEDLMYKKIHVNVDKLLKKVATKVLQKEAMKSNKDNEPYEETNVEFDSKYATATNQASLPAETEEWVKIYEHKVKANVDECRIKQNQTKDGRFKN